MLTSKQAIHLLGKMRKPNLRGLGSSPTQAPAPSFLTVQTLRRQSDGSGSGLPATYMGELEFSAPSFDPGPALAVTGILEVNQQMRAVSSFLCLKYCF